MRATVRAFVPIVMDFVRHVGSDNDSFIDDNSLTVVASAVPEPSSFVLAGVGGATGLAISLSRLVRKRPSAA